MSTATTTSTTSSSPPSRQEDYIRFKHYAALSFLIAAPVIIALPPRKLDLYTASLGTAFFVSANHITTERSGKGIIAHVGGYLSRHKLRVFSELPGEQAEEVQKQIRLGKEKERELELEAERARVASEGGELSGDKDKERGLQKLGKKIWMGGETEGWKERRLEEERKALEEGRGYGDLIMEYIMDAWRMEKDGDGEVEGEGEKKKK